MTTKTLFLDVDGPCADFVKHMLDTLRHEGVQHGIMTVTVRDFTKCREQGGLMPPGGETVANAIMSRPTWWRTMPVVRAAQHAVEDLRHHGWDVVAVTAPWYGCTSWENARRAWLEEHFGIRNKDVIPTHRKELVHALEGVEVFLDDHPDHVERWSAKGTGVGMLLDFPWNRDSIITERVIKQTHPRRVRNWDHAVELMKGMDL